MSCISVVISIKKARRQFLNALKFGFVHHSSDTPLKLGLYVISVPIGNLQDITLRALETLKSLKKIYCEDTRVTRKLLSLYQIDPPILIRCDDHTQGSVTDSIKEDIHNGLAVGLISDAGTPLISDPGYVIISQLRTAKMPIYPIIGACAGIAALSVSGLPTTTFQFKGFVPKKQKQRLEIIDMIDKNPDTYIFYERPERIASFLSLFPEAMTQSLCFVAREITKMHEEYQFSTIFEMLQILPNMTLKGEAVVIISNHNISNQSEIDISAVVTQYLQAGKSPKDISRDADLLKHASRNQLYEIAQSLKNHD
ncbi:MAG: 16S rRNA (cytidine1402-2'-O)-methyltransferase [Alphaproteobacteria bacterium]|jgi:16S rRNA (cytidine1402-2'-O)-methyltransferase